MTEKIINQLEGLKNLSKESFDKQKAVLSAIPINFRAKLYANYCTYDQLKELCIEEIKVGQIVFVDLILKQLKKKHSNYYTKLKNELDSKSWDNPNL